MQTVDYFVLALVVLSYLAWIFGRENPTQPTNNSA